MSRFESLARDKITVIEEIASSQEILKALVHNEGNFLDKEDVDVDSVMYKHIFPYRFIPKTSEKMKTYITISFGRYKNVEGSFKSGIVKFNVFTHQDLFCTDYGTLRTDYIIMKLDELFNKNKKLGIGKAEFYDMDELSVNTDYHGSYVAYKTYDFN
ncbi:hypothetical protein HUB98_06360 [Paenibacillus barcinonensis]|uniref:Uncharacterized protein n=1 Tax=Paenibacillus barcinonensis TaxID=198119 RepID=A0A2V4WHL2_PAEBA|nr:hypothetical protein [Paenibacillus barcinonensis]PYE51640.1 hypothetical protein DFQ00_102435 [Paenibacillus barcinonensis]QKS56002.1 hypothetical protein HUB98_06360 [Paenibacillus barcinonensis]